MATSIMMCCSGAAGAVLSPVISKVIIDFGWRNGYRAVAAIVLFLCLPIMLYRRNLIAAEAVEKEDVRQERDDLQLRRDPTTYAVLIAFLIT